MSIKQKLINIIFNIITGSRKFRILLTPVIGLSYVAFACFFVFSSFAFDKLINLSGFISYPIISALSIPVISTGLLIILWSQFYFLKSGGTPVPINPPPKLVTGGPYFYMRNPMLSGIFILLFGLGFANGSISLLFIFTPLFILINVTELKYLEEPELEKRFKQDYIKYKKKTPMFFPFI